MYSVSFSTSLTPLVAFYFLCWLVSVKALRIGVTSRFFTFPAWVCTVVKRDPGKPENRKEASSFCLSCLHRTLAFSFKIEFQDYWSFPCSYVQPFVSQAKAIYHLVWRSRAHTTEAGNEECVCLCSSMERQCEMRVGRQTSKVSWTWAGVLMYCKLQ